MFKCENCQQSGERPNRIVTKRKMVQHTTETVGPRGGRGSQIVEEKNVCNACVPLVNEAPIEHHDPGVLLVTIMLNGEELTNKKLEQCGAEQ